MKLPSETVLNEREIRFLLDGHGHDGKDSAYINRNISITTAGVSSSSAGLSTSNHTTDSSGNNFTGTLTGTPGPTQVTSPWSGVGPFTNALSFPGTGHSGVNCGAWDSGGVTAIYGTGVAAQFTLEARIQFTSLISRGAVCGWFNTDQPPQLFGSPADMEIFWTDNTGTGFSIGGSIGNDLNSHILAATYDGVTMRLFNDGILIASQATTGIHAYNSGDNFWIGSDDQTEDIAAIIDEVRWSNICRYTANYTSATTPFTSDANTLALYHLDNGSLGATTPTVSGGTVRGATVVIAASNASAASKAGADFVCTGTNDGTAINNFILGGSLAPASIVFTEGTFNLDTFIFVLDKTSAYGEGWATIFHILPGNSVNPGGFQVGAGAILKNFSINIDPGNNHLEGYLIHQSTISSSYTIDNIYVYGGGGVARIIVDTNKDLNMFNCVFNMDPPPDPFIAGSIIALTNTNATDNGIININNNIFINCELTFGNPIYNYLIIVNNNYFTGTPGADTIVTFAKNNIIIDNNIFSNCNQQSQLMTITSDWAKISNNIFNSCLRISMSNRLSGLFINNQYQNTIDTQLVLFLDEGNHMVQGNLFDGGTPRNAVYAFNGQNVVINNRFGPTAFGIGPAIFHNSGTLLLNLDGSSNNWNYGV